MTHRIKRVEPMSHVARLVHYEKSLNATSTEVALERIEAQLPSRLKPAAKHLKQLALENTNDLTPASNSINALRDIANMEGGDKCALVVSYFEQISSSASIVLTFWNGLRSIFRYALAVGIIIFITMGILSAKVLPEFSEIFASFGDSLPEFTRFVLSATQYFNMVLIFSCLLVASCYFLVLSLKKRIQCMEPLWKGIKNIPALNKLLETYQYYLYLQYLYILTKANISTQSSMKHAHKLSQLSDIKSNNIAMLSTALSLAGDLQHLPEELEYQNTKISDALLENLLLLRDAVYAFIMSILGILVGGSLIAIYLPIFALGGAVS